MTRLLEGQLALDALAATGVVLARLGQEDPIRLVIAGGTAGLLGELLSAARTTGDCDVMMWTGQEAEWRRVLRAAAEVAERLGLPPAWLNDDCKSFAWCLPIGWQDRCEEVGQFGPLRVSRIARLDLIAAKVFSSPRRPQDLEDVRYMRPTQEELGHAERNIDRLEAEDLDGSTFDHARAIVQALRGGT